MAIWPFKKKQVRKAQAAVQPTIAISNVRSRADWATPFRNAQSYLSPSNDPNVLRILRQAIPMLDSAIDKLVRLTGSVKIIWDSETVQAQWDAWAEMVKVAPLGHSFNNWLNGLQERALTFGNGASEIVLDNAGKDIYGFQYISSSSLRLRPDPDNLLDVIIAQQQTSQALPVQLDREFIALAAHEARDNSPYGQGIFADIPFVAELLIEMVHAEKMNWIRLGAPSHAVLVGVPKDLDPSVNVSSMMQTLLNSIETDWTDAMTSRQTKGTVKDFFGAGDIRVVTIGADAKMLEFQIPWRAALEQVVAVTHLPPWMLGLHWSTTERLSEEQARSLEEDIFDYQQEYNYPALFAADWWARVRGYSSAARTASWPALAIRDRVELARAELIGAQAQSTKQKTGRQLWADGIYAQQQYADYVTGQKNTPVENVMSEPAPSVDSAGSARLLSTPSALAKQREILYSGQLYEGRAGSVCGHIHKADDAEVTYGQGEEPNDDRIRDVIQAFYSDARGAARSLRERLWGILNLPDLNMTTETRSLRKQFEFTPQQERAVDRAIEIFLARMAGSERSKGGFISPDTGDGIIQQYNVFAHAIGARRGAEMTGEDAVRISTGRSSLEAQALLDHAFDRLSDNGRLRLEGVLDDIKEILHEGVGLGTNPLDLARELSSRFDAYEGHEFRRLARTEAAFAQVEGQMNEFRTEGVDASGVEADPPPWHP